MAEDDLSRIVAKYLGRSRQAASIGDFGDFSTSVSEGSENYDVSIEIIENKEDVKNFMFRSKKNGK